jgi:hypothetical protein
LFPQGGFVDILARIQAGYQFCMKTNRVLVVDTTRTQFGVPLERYLRFPSDCVHFHHRKDPTDQQELDALVTELLSGNNGRTVFPASMRGVRSEQLKIVYTPAPKGGKATFAHADSLLSWELSEFRDEHILVNSYWGGANDVNDILSLAALK